MADPFHSSPTAAAAGDSLLAPQTSDAPEAALPAVAPDLDAEFGFQRPEFGKEKLAGTVGFHQRHVFLCYKSPAEWPSHVEATDSDRPPRILADAIKARKSNLNKSTKLTICEGEDGTESSLGDVLIFPDMIRYRGLTHFDVDNFVEEVLVKDVEWLPGSPEAIKGSYVFVCAHGSRDKRCGVCGPALITRFKEEIEGQGLDGQVAVSACSHVGGHKYAGNVIIFSSDAKGEVTGHWYGYVAPDDVPVLLHKHIGQGEIVDHLWRGQLGMTEEQQKKALELKHITNGVTGEESSTKEANGTNGTACNPATKQDKSVPLKGTNIGDVVEADWMKKGTQFVESFYKTLDSAPETLHEFYSAKCDVTWEIFQDSRRMKSSKEIQEFLALPANQFFFCFSLKRHVVQTSKKAIHVAAYGIYTAEKESHNFMQSFVLRHRNRRILNDALLVLCDDREVKEDVVAAARTKFTEDKQSVAEELGCRTANANRRVAPRKFKLKIVPKLAAGSKLTTPEAGDEVKRFDVMLVYNEECLEHIPYENPEHHEHPDRIRRIMARLEADGILERVLRQRSEPAERKHLLAAHSEQHVSNIDRLPEQFGTGDMYSSAGTKDAVYLAAGAVIKACEAVFKGHVKKAFALVRPPGHHASTNTAEGFCYVNNVAVGSKYLQNECLVEKVLQVDIDVHHGNGSQCIFYESNTVMVFSTHCLDLKYPPKYNVEKNRRPFHTCTGEKEGKGYNVNMPMQLGFGDSDILYAIDQILAPLVSVFKPGKIIVSAGFDAADGDPLGRCKVTPKCYGTVIDKLVEMGNGELILCLEGGYGSESLPACVSHCLRALLGDKAASLSEDELSSLPEPLEDTKDTVRKLKKLLMNQWEVLRN